jgi:hypothetical protein
VAARADTDGSRWDKTWMMLAAIAANLFVTGRGTHFGIFRARHVLPVGA